jgi:type VI secretion system secreted protein Hcp
MAETVHLFLKANGEDVKGESSQTSLGREGSIECVYFSSSVRTAREAGSGQATGRRTYEPVVIRKRIDKSTPRLARALTDNEVIEATFKFYRPNPNGDGTTQQFFTVKLAKGRIASFNMTVPDCVDPASSTHPPLEEIAFVFHSITWTYTDGGVEHQDTWDQNR